eukprot:734533-Rhodomonas_salina.1
MGKLFALSDVRVVQLTRKIDCPHQSTDSLPEDRNRYAIVQNEAGEKSHIPIGADGLKLNRAPAHTDSVTASTDPAPHDTRPEREDIPEPE